MMKSIRMPTKITGSASNIYSLIEAAVFKYCDEENFGENPGIGVALGGIISILNSDEYNNRRIKYDLKVGTLQKSIYNPAKKLVIKEDKGNIGLTFISPYLNRLSMYVHQKGFEEEYGKFRGVLSDITQGIEELSIDNESYLKDMKELGITGTVNKLSSSRFEPDQCIEETKYTLNFMGILGSKWVTDKDKFVEFLKKIQSRPQGKVRYLMIDPTGESFRQLKTMRGENLKDVSTQIFRELVDEFRCLEAKFYDFIPCFRLIFIDGKICAVSRYKLEENAYIRSNKGWEAPHLVIDAEQGDWSLYEPFLSYYETIWKQAKDIRDIIKR